MPLSNVRVINGWSTVRAHSMTGYVLQWNNEAQALTELFDQQYVEELKRSLSEGQEKMKNELAQLADTLTEVVQQQLIET